MSFERPYEGIKVVDMSQGIAGPYCAMLLAQHGAEVVKVEPPQGDWARGLGASNGNHTEYSFIANFGKRSLAIDLKCEEAPGIIDSLVAEADVFLEGFRPGVIDRLGFGHERLMALNPGLIYVSISGFGQTGPLRGKPAMDPVLQAFSGYMLDNKGEDGIPHRTHTVINDMSTALYTFQAVTPALYGKRDGARGRFLDISLMRGAANLSVIRVMTASVEGELKRNLRTTPSGIFKTAEGWLQLVTLQDKDFLALCDILGRDDWRADESLRGNEGRRAQADMLLDGVAEALLSKSAAQWREIFTEAGMQNEILQSFNEFLAHPQVLETELFSYIPLDGLEQPLPMPNPPGIPKIEPDTAYGTSPITGQHSDEILAQLGRDTDAIADLRQRGVITTWTG